MMVCERDKYEKYVIGIQAREVVCLFVCFLANIL